jgi:hypothetical protein
MATLQKVHYRPIEAAIRWSGLVRHEPRILEVLQERPIPEPHDFPEWPSLRLSAERIYDAIQNRELVCSIDGVTTQDIPHINDAHLTIRHVDLRAWMTRYYPGVRPPFLFSRVERQAVHPAITVDTLHALVFEREALKLEIEQRNREIQTLREERAALLKPSDSAPPVASDELRSPRSETTYLHIVGGLLSLLLGRSPSGHPYSSFHTQESIITALMAHHGGRLGITTRTLETKFAAARRSLSR